MIIKELRLSKFRNYFYENLKFDPKINIFLGDNAQGKTNLLEAVFFCANATSFKKIKDSDLIMFKENEMNLKALIQKNNSFKKIDINDTKEKKTIIVNDIKYKKNRDLKALFNIVTFTPEDLRIAKEGPSLRREFFDDIIVSVDFNYWRIKRKYLRLLFERNKLLKNRNVKFFNQELDAFDKQLAKEGAKINVYRDRYIKFIEKFAKKYLSLFTNGKEELEISYIADIKAFDYDSYYKSLKDNRDNDLLRYTTTKGIHRDDIDILINGKNIRDFASQGQQRSAILVLKLSQIELIKAKLNEKSIVLLDDVFSELDEKRSGFLLDNLRDYQTIITSTDFTNIEKIKNSNIRRIEKGSIKS